ncbi:MAG: glycosyltransferase [Ignavibacteria bacterium]|nr:glycosyltransferase [Ignavibacteria bacterium]
MNEYLNKIKKELVGTTVPMVSVIVPLYNYQEYVLETIDSVVKQTYKDWELIIVDDYSTDNSYNVVRLHIQNLPNININLYQNERNSGVAAAMNHGLRYAKGKYILPLDADDKIAPIALEKYVAAAETNNADIAYSRSEQFQDANHIWMPPAAHFFKYVPWRNLLQSASMYRRDILDTIGNYDEDFSTMQDYVLWIRFGIYGFLNVVPIDETLFYYRSHGVSQSVETTKNYKLFPQLVLKHRDFYHPYYVRWAEGVMADDPKCIELWYGTSSWMMPNFVQLIEWCEEKDWEVIKQKLRDEFLPQIYAGNFNTIIPITLPNGSVVEIEYTNVPLHGDLIIGHKEKDVQQTFLPNPFPQGRTQPNPLAPFPQGRGDNPMVSVVVPLYNYQEYVLETIDSVVKQTYKDWELIIVDDCSTDNSYNVVRLHIQNLQGYNIRLEHNARNVGLSATRNAGISKANGKYILPLDADDMLAPTYLERTMAEMLASGADMVYTGLQCFGDENNIIQGIPYDAALMLLINIMPSCSLFKREVWENVGGYDESFTQAEDYNFWLSSMQNGFIGKLVAEPLVLYRVHSDSMSHEVDDYAKGNEMQAKLMLAHRELFEEQQVEWAEQVIARVPEALNMPNNKHVFYSPNATFEQKYEKNKQIVIDYYRKHNIIITK